MVSVDPACRLSTPVTITWSLPLVTPGPAVPSICITELEPFASVRLPKVRIPSELPGAMVPWVAVPLVEPTVVLPDTPPIPVTLPPPVTLVLPVVTLPATLPLPPSKPLPRCKVPPLFINTPLANTLPAAFITVPLPDTVNKPVVETVLPDCTVVLPPLMLKGAELVRFCNVRLPTLETAPLPVTLPVNKPPLVTFRLLPSRFTVPLPLRVLMDWFPLSRVSAPALRMSTFKLPPRMPAPFTATPPASICRLDGAKLPGAPASVSVPALVGLSNTVPVPVTVPV